MGLEVLEFIFMWIGKLVWKLFKILYKNGPELSDGTYEVIGLLSIVVLSISLFIVWGIVNV